MTAFSQHLHKVALQPIPEGCVADERDHGCAHSELSERKSLSVPVMLVCPHQTVSPSFREACFPQENQVYPMTT